MLLIQRQLGLVFKQFGERGLTCPQPPLPLEEADPPCWGKKKSSSAT